MLKKLNIKFDKKLVWVVEVFVFFGGLYYFATRSDNPKIVKTLTSQAATQTSLQPAVEFSGKSVKGSVICLDIDPNNHLPLLPKDSFNSNIDYLYCYTTFESGNAPAEVTFSWMHRNEQIGQETVRVDRQSNAAWCKMEMITERRGKWRVYIADSDGNQVDEVAFRLY